MAKIDISVPHHLSQGEATRRIQKLLGEMKVERADQISDLREDWQGNTGTFSFKAMGYKISGVLDVKPAEVKLSGELPFAASIFKGKIQSAISERAKSLLA